MCLKCTGNMSIPTHCILNTHINAHYTYTHTHALVIHKLYQTNTYTTHFPHTPTLWMWLFPLTPLAFVTYSLDYGTQHLALHHAALSSSYIKKQIIMHTHTASTLHTHIDTETTHITA